MGAFFATALRGAADDWFFEAPPFAEVEATVADAWHEAQRAEARRRSYEAMRAKYALVLPSPPTEVAEKKLGSVDALP